MNQLEGSGPPPASKDQIDTLPSTQITQEQVGESPNTTLVLLKSVRIMYEMLRILLYMTFDRELVSFYRE